MATATKDQANIKPATFGKPAAPKEPDTPAQTLAKAAEKDAPQWPSKVFEVEIPLCLLGKRIIHAESEEEALERYKRLGGILQHDHPAKIRELVEHPDSPLESFKEKHLQEVK